MQRFEIHILRVNGLHKQQIHAIISLGVKHFGTGRIYTQGTKFDGALHASAAIF